MSPLEQTRFMRGLISRDAPERSKKTNWGKTLSIILISSLAAGGVAFAVGKLLAMSRGASAGLQAMLGAAAIPRLPTIWQRLLLPIQPSAPLFRAFYKLLTRRK